MDRYIKIGAVSCGLYFDCDRLIIYSAIMLMFTVTLIDLYFIWKRCDRFKKRIQREKFRRLKGANND